MSDEQARIAWQTDHIEHLYKQLGVTNAELARLRRLTAVLNRQYAKLRLKVAEIAQLPEDTPTWDFLATDMVKLDTELEDIGKEYYSRPENKGKLRDVLDHALNQLKEEANIG